MPWFWSDQYELSLQIAGVPSDGTKTVTRPVKDGAYILCHLKDDGTLVGASDAARPLLCFRNLSEAGLDDARSSALIQGRVETPIGSHHMVLQRVGHGADVGLVALIAPAPDQPIPDYEQPAISGEAPAEFALIDEFAESTTAETTVEQVAADEPTEPDLQSVLQPMPHVEASPAETPPQTMTPDPEIHEDEPSPYVEPVADEPAPPPAACTGLRISQNRSSPGPPAKTCRPESRESNACLQWQSQNRPVRDAGRSARSLPRSHRRSPSRAWPPGFPDSASGFPPSQCWRSRA